MLPFISSSPSAYSSSQAFGYDNRTMPLAALTPVLNDLLHKAGGGGGGNSSPPLSPQHFTAQQVTNANDSSSAHAGEYRRKGSQAGQSTGVVRPLSSSSVDDVSI